MRPFLVVWILVLTVALAGCENLGGLDHVELARRALAGLCSAPSDGLSAIFPDPSQRAALHLLCSVLGYAPRV